MDQRFHRDIDLAAPVQKIEFDNACGTRDLCANVLQQIYGCGQCATSCQQIIQNDNTFARLHGICLNFNDVRAIFQRIFVGYDCTRQFALLADHYEAEAELQCQRGRC